ncbi:MAG TPA: ABC transporter ATP-binding protein [Spirochaetia bacterium]|nr:ABC transporter ATP-binding protein [Spirochaetia bacterium]
MGTVELSQVWKIYDNHFEAVKGITATLRDGEFISLLGPSGCGKTSTLRMIAGLEAISRGDIRIDGIRVNELEPGDRNIAMAFESYALYPHLTVFENIAYPLRIRRTPEAEIQRQVSAICDSLGISAYRNLRPSSLSGGAQQRTGLARALVRSASLYLLDEVLSHLDANERVMLRGEIRRVQKLMKLTALFVTHDQLEALAMSDRIIVMNDGELQQIGTPEEIYDTPENLFVAGFVGEPAVNTFPAERIREGGRDLLSIAGQKVGLADLRLPAVPDRQKFIIGIRPKHLVLGTAAAPGYLRGQVHTFEVLGDFTLAALTMGTGDLVFKVGDAGLRLALDQPLTFSFDPGKVLFYDVQTTSRIRPGQ